MAVQALNGGQAANAQQGVQGARTAVPTVQELLTPREGDKVDFTKEAQDRAKAEDARLQEQQQAQTFQQGNAEQVKQEQDQQTNIFLNRSRVDLLA